MLHLITGGSGSGKSRYAEGEILKLGPGRRIYIATMYPYDEESRQRIARHRAMRAEKNFETIECYTALNQRDFPEGANILLECMSNLVANEMFRPEGARLHTVEAVLIFSDGAEYDSSTRVYQEYLGTINQEIARWADRVTEVVCGIPIALKGGDLE